jgi:4-amino-4-deoxy-L-arabinose transferase-like glycosyltransferase
VNDGRLPRLQLFAVLGVLFLGAALRMHALEARPLGHTESYVPGIDLPADFGEPRARMTLTRAVTNSMWEVHPPGWYAFMWGWTKAFGTGLTAIRLPGVLAGAVCIVLVFLLARREGDRWTAVLAAALVAVNGHQIYWAQVARPATILCALGLAAAVLLLGAGRGGRRALAGYGVVLVAGLLIEYYFWILVAVHVLWNLLDNWRHRATALAVLRTQLLAIILASPIVTLAVFQSRGAHFDGNLTEGVRDFLEIGFLYVSVSPVPHAVPAWANLLLPVVGAVLLLVGLWRSRGVTRRDAGEGAADGPGVLLTAIAAAVMTAVVLVAASFYAQHVPAKASTLRATAALPAALGFAAYLVRSPSALVPRVWGACLDALRLTGGTRSLVVTMAVLPAALVAAATLATPLFAARQMLLFVPYLLVVMARGIRGLVAVRPRMAGVTVALVLLVGLGAAHAASLRWYAQRLQSPHDYRELAQKWKPQLLPGDVVLVQDHWSTTPLFYYLDRHAHRFVWKDWPEAVARDPGVRVWRLAFDGYAVPEEIRAALAGRHETDRVTAFGVTAELWLAE